MHLVDFVGGRLVVAYPRAFPQSRKRMLRKPFKDRQWWHGFNGKRTLKNRYSQPIRVNPFVVMAELRTFRRMKTLRTKHRE